MYSWWQDGRTPRSRPRTLSPYQMRDHSSFPAWLVDPLITQELPVSSVATAEPVRHVAMGLMLEACAVAGLGICDASMVR